jgi:hypothetical protein
LVHVALFNSELVLTKGLEHDTGQNLYGASWFADAEVHCRLEPILRAELEQHQSNPQLKPNTKLRGIHDLMAGVSAPLKGVLADGSDAFEDNEGLEYHSGEVHGKLQLFWQMICQPDPEAGDADYVAHAFYFTYQILFNLIQGRPHHHAANQSSLDALYTIMPAISDSTWQSLPYHRIWM